MRVKQAPDDHEQFDIFATEEPLLRLGLRRPQHPELTLPVPYDVGLDLDELRDLTDLEIGLVWNVQGHEHLPAALAAERPLSASLI